ncbi:MAG: sensor histidine kinase, partial [Romboutsia sp.]
MKFWQKIFIYSVILCIIVFNSASIFIIEGMHKENIDNQIFSTMNEYENILSGIYFNFDSSNNVSLLDESNINNWLSVAIKGYINTDNSNL